MSSGQNCDNQEASWNIGDHTVRGTICRFDDVITINFRALGSVAFPYSEGETAFRVSLGFNNQPFRTALSNARDLIPPQVNINIPSANDLLPDEFDGGSINLEVTDSNSGGSGSYPLQIAPSPSSYEAIYSKEVDVPRPTIPVIGGGDRIRDALPDSVTIEASVSPANAFDRILFGSKTMEFEIPVESLVELREIEIDCGAQHSELFSAARDIREDAEDFISDINDISLPSRNRVDSIEEARDDIRERINEFGGERTLRDIFDNDQTAIERLREGRLTDFNSLEEAQEELENLREDLQSVVQDLNRIRTEHSLGGLRQSLNTIRNRRGDVGSLCRDEFEDLAGDLNLNRVEDALDQYSQMRRQLENIQFLVDGLPPEINVPEPPEGPEDTPIRDEVEDIREQLEEIPDSIRERVRELRDRLESIRSTPFIDRDPGNLNDARQEARELIEDIEDLESGRPGRSEALGEARGILGDLTRLNAAEQSSLPCSSRFPDAEDLVTEFEAETESITTDVTEDRLEALTSVEEAAVSAIESVDNESCREHFRRRLKRADRRVDIKVSPIRVAQELVDQNRERRANLLAQLGISTNIENIGNVGSD